MNNIFKYFGELLGKKSEENKNMEINIEKSKPNKVSSTIMSKLKEIKSKLRLRKQLMMVFITISVLPVVFMGSFLYYIASSQMNMSQKSMLSAHAEGIKNNVNSTIVGSQNILKSLSAQSDMLVLFEDYLDNNEINDGVRLNKILISMENTVKSSEKLYETIFIGDLKGNVIADGSKYNDKYMKLNMSESDYFKKIKAGHKFMVGEPVKSNATGRYVIPVAASIESLASKMGIMVIMFDLERFTNNMDNIEIGKTGAIMILNQAGNVVYSKDKSKLLTKVENKLVEEQVKNIKSGEVNISGFGSFKYDNKNSVSAFRAIESTEWLAVTYIPKVEFYRSTTTIGSFIIVLMLFLSVIVLYVSIRYSQDVALPIDGIVKLMKEVAEGNINVKANFRTSHEIGVLTDNFNEMTYQLKTLIDEIVIVSKSVSKTSANNVKITGEALEHTKHVVYSIDHIAKGANEQAADVECGVKQIEGFASIINNINSDASSMMLASTTTDEAVKNGFLHMKKLNNKAESSNDISIRVYSEVVELVENIKEIEIIISTINSISKQTKLLSLNASIEAARAGELGRGFSVVAEEVKKLSEMSAHNTREVTTIIKSIEKKVSIVQEIANLNKKVVSEQNEIVNNAEQAFSTIYTEVDKMKALISGVAAKIENMNEEKESMLKTVSNISQITSSTAESSNDANLAATKQFEDMEEIKENSAELDKASEDLLKSLSIFAEVRDCYEK